MESMFRLLFIFIIACMLYGIARFVVLLWRVTSTVLASGNGARRPVHTQQNLVKCCGCHVYVLENDAVTVGGKSFCSLEHAQQ